LSPAKAPVLYLGDTSLATAASYLGAVMRHAGIGFHYVGSQEKADRFLETGGYRLIILSDYPAKNLSEGQMKGIAEMVREGGGLLMIGGWDSFHGSGGLYGGTVIEELLPVHIATSDDRVNHPFPCLVSKCAEHPIVSDLPFGEAPCIGGYNRIRAKGGAEVLLEAIRYRTRAEGSFYAFVEEGRDALLVVGRIGQGRSAAFASDAAPHWVGGLVDWGLRRVSQQIAGIVVEMGEFYAEFFNKLIHWAGGL
jgi:uncharacterized membrane protein